MTWRRLGALRPGRALLGKPWLVALCVGGTVLEAVLLSLAGPRSAMGLAPQASALAPFGVFCDLRWLIVYHNSWPGFAGEALALLVGRAMFTAATVAAAWPETRPRPALARLVVRSTVFTALAAVLLAPWTVLLFGLAVISVSWLFIAAVPSALIIALLVHPGAVSAGWWRRTPAPKALAWVLSAFVALSAGAGVISVAPVALAIPLAALAGWFNAWAWRGMTKALVCRGLRGSFRPVAPAALALFLALAVGGAVLGFSTVAHAKRAPRAAVADGGGRSASGGAVLVATGFGNSWDGGGPALLPGPYLERRFSYAGLAPSGHPLPYTGADSNRSLDRLDRLMAAQVNALSRRAGGPISIVAESEGALVAKTYLEATPRAPVKTLVMLSPLVQPARVYYPPTGTAGWGLAGGLGLADLSAGLQGVAPISLSPGAPFLRSLVADAALVRTVLSCPLPGVRQFAVLPLADAVAAPGPFPASIPTAVVPAFHGGLLGNGADHRLVSTVLAGQAPSATSVWSIAEQVIRPASSAWQVPDLPLAEDPGSDLAAAGGAQPTSTAVPDCDQMRRLLQAQLTATVPATAGDQS